nr:hypothetical protein HK105_006347 [Polyrhizophydium stewartii]
MPQHLVDYIIAGYAKHVRLIAHVFTVPQEVHTSRVRKTLELYTPPVAFAPLAHGISADKWDEHCRAEEERARAERQAEEEAREAARLQAIADAKAKADAERAAMLLEQQREAERELLAPFPDIPHVLESKPTFERLFRKPSESSSVSATHRGMSHEAVGAAEEIGGTAGDASGDASRSSQQQPRQTQAASKPHKAAGSTSGKPPLAPTQADKRPSGAGPLAPGNAPHGGPPERKISRGNTTVNAKLSAIPESGAKQAVSPASAHLFGGMSAADLSHSAQSTSGHHSGGEGPVAATQISAEPSELEPAEHVEVIALDARLSRNDLARILSANVAGMLSELMQSLCAKIDAQAEMAQARIDKLQRAMAAREEERLAREREREEALATKTLSVANLGAGGQGGRDAHGKDTRNTAKKPPTQAGRK